MDARKVILVTGSNGQLGQSFQAISKNYPEFEFVFTGKEDLDISDREECRLRIEKHRPHAIINCAAYTNVEKAEDEPEMAMLYNANSLRNLSLLCREHDIKLIHFSTDYVFNGLKKTPYTEGDYCSPLCKYGESKREGEIILGIDGAPHYTLRVSWLYSPYGHNFYKTILKRSKEHSQLRVVDDQVASPTYAVFLAEDVMSLLRITLIEGKQIPYGIYHYEQTGEASWFDFASMILQLHNITTPIDRVSTEAFPMKANRPSYSKLSGHLFFTTTNIQQRTWGEGLQGCIAFERSHQ
jgi:dTDP-4-dehydrorhamnose reductase